MSEDRGSNRMTFIIFLNAEKDVMLQGFPKKTELSG